MIDAILIKFSLTQAMILIGLAFKTYLGLVQQKIVINVFVL